MAEAEESISFDDDRLTLDASKPIPDDAVAVDVPCPHCGERPIESVAKGYRITGMLLVYRRRTFQVVGCGSCIRRTLLGAAGKNLLLGWWSIRSFIANPFATGWNVFRGLLNRGPTEHLAAALDGSGVSYEFLTDRDEWDPDDHYDELQLDAMLRLATATMRADGSVDPEEVQIVLDVVDEAYPDYDEETIGEKLQVFGDEDVDVAATSAVLTLTLPEEDRRAVLGVLLSVASADGAVNEAERDVLAAAASGFGFDEEQFRDALAGTPEQDEHTVRTAGE